MNSSKKCVEFNLNAYWNNKVNYTFLQADFALENFSGFQELNFARKQVWENQIFLM
jgi:hypothetical protein